MEIPQCYLEQAILQNVTQSANIQGLWVLGAKCVKALYYGSHLQGCFLTRDVHLPMRPWLLQSVRYNPQVRWMIHGGTETRKALLIFSITATLSESWTLPCDTQQNEQPSRYLFSGSRPPKDRGSVTKSRLLWLSEWPIAMESLITLLEVHHVPAPLEMPKATGFRGSIKHLMVM